MNVHISGVRRMAAGAAAWLAAFMLLVMSMGGVPAAKAAPTTASTTNTQAAEKAINWMKTQQQTDGSFAGFGAGSTIDALFAILAAGQDPSVYSQNGNTPITFLESKAGDIVKNPGGAGKLLVAAQAAGMDGKAFGGVDLIGAIEATYGISATGQYGPDAVGHAFSLLGLHAAGIELKSEAVNRLASLQTSEGGWAYSGAGKPDTNTTSVAVQALLAAGIKADSAPMQKALRYLLSQRNSDGGYPYQQGGDYGSDSDANSTAYVVQALFALGASADAEVGQKYLLSLQTTSGAFLYMKTDKDDNAGATYQVVSALYNTTLINVKPTAAPGMPTTGNSTDLALVALGITIALGAISLGAAARRKAPAR